MFVVCPCVASLRIDPAMPAIRPPVKKVKGYPFVEIVEGMTSAHLGWFMVISWYAPHVTQTGLLYVEGTLVSISGVLVMQV